MTDDIRRDADRTDEFDRRDQPVDPARVDEHGGARRDADLEYAEDRPPAHPDDAARGTADPVATDRGVAADAATTEGRVEERDTHRDPTSERRPGAGPGTTSGWGDEGLLSSDDRGSFQKRWDDIQVRFIDEPRQCVREADDLVSEVTTRISDRFSSARQDMEQRWDSGNEPTTEELRQAVQRYRDFFQRLVAH